MGFKEKQTSKINSGDWKEMNKVDISKGSQRTETLLALPYSTNNSHGSSNHKHGDKYLSLF